MVETSLETWRRLHLSIASALEVKASPCPFSWCFSAVGILVSHLTPWGHGGTAARTASGIIPPESFLARCGEGMGKSFEVSPAVAERGQGSVLFVYMPCMCLGSTLRRIDRSCRKAE